MQLYKYYNQLVSRQSDCLLGSFSARALSLAYGIVRNKFRTRPLLIHFSCNVADVCTAGLRVRLTRVGKMNRAGVRREIIAPRRACSKTQRAHPGRGEKLAS